MNREHRIVALPLCYQDVIEAVRARVIAINAPHQILEQHMQIAPGYLSKVLGLAQIRSLGFTTIWKILDGLGYRMALVEHLDLDAVRDEIEDYRTHQVLRVPPGKVIRKNLSPAILKEAARRYGMLSRGIRKVFRITPEEVSRQRRNAINARWSRHKSSTVKEKTTC